MLGVEFVLDSLSQNKDEIYKRKKKKREYSLFPHVLNMLIRFGVVFSGKVLKSWTEHL